MADGSCGNQVHWGALSIVAINAMMGSSFEHVRAKGGYVSNQPMLV